MSAVILMTGVGSYLPKNKFSNEDLSQFIDTSDEWITKRSGIKSRHFVSKNELTSDLATNAALKAVQMSGLNIKDIDLIIVATTTPDNTFPSTATRVQQKLGAKGIAFDVQAVCAGFVFALSVASSMMKDNHSKNCIVIGADSMSKLLNWEDRTTSVLFGDGAGAVVLQKKENLDKKFNGWGILSNVIHSDGNFYDLLYTNAGVSLNQKVGFIEMVGKEVFKHAVEKLCSSFQEALDLCNKDISDIDWLIPHQANVRILNFLAKKLGVHPDKVVVTLDRHANTSAASVPLALDVASRDGRIQPGQIVLLQGVGGGFTWGSVLLKV